MDSMSIDLAAGVCGFAASALMSKSRSVPPLCYTRVGMVLCGSGAALALRCKGAAKAGIASVAGAGCLLLFARWDNARAELAPRWEPHGRGATGAGGAAAARVIWRSSARRTTAPGAEPFDPAANPNASDQLYRRERLRAWRASHPREALTAEPLAKALAFYQQLQCDDGHWGGDYGGPHFLSPGLVVVWYVTGRRDDVLDEHQRRAMVRYYENHQQTDGGWGTHVESPSTMFGSVLTYVALRLLGEPADAPACAAGRKLILEQGGACYVVVGQTNYVCIGPVNKVYNMLVAYDDRHADGGEALARHALRVPDYLWVAEDGMKMQGYNGSQCWDASFATQAIAESDLGDDARFRDCAKKAWSYLERTQILSTTTSQASPAFAFEKPELREKYFRHVSKGGWPFSTSAHGWPISDCTAEGLKSVLALRSLKCVGECKPIGYERLCDAADVADGGYATYENTRGYGWYEWLNPSEVFGDIMIDYSYVECSMASNGALAHLHRRAGPPRGGDRGGAEARQRVPAVHPARRRLLVRLLGLLLHLTRAGSASRFSGFGEDRRRRSRRACAFLLRHQRPNGGWGEDFTSCFDKAYAKNGMEAYGDAEGAGVVCTGWALLGLMAGACADADAVARGVAYLEARQLPDGDWPQEGISGVFNRSCGITYGAPWRA
ncbi:oxidosqualene cyclase [Aureococcus anophagefferens]|nr:oxidosqualene cyclase [Aureococcus anophagefferens]